MTRYWLIAIAVVLLLGFLSRRGERADSKPTQIRPGGNSPTAADIDALLRAGQKIEAIKLYRQLHGVDLKAAKDVIDARARELGT
jgi:ribosomal protein L7/L12